MRLVDRLSFVGIGAVLGYIAAGPLNALYKFAGCNYNNVEIEVTLCWAAAAFLLPTIPYISRRFNEKLLD